MKRIIIVVAALVIAAAALAAGEGGNDVHVDQGSKIVAFRRGRKVGRKNHHDHRSDGDCAQQQLQ